MLEKILKMYVMFMATGVSSPLPHLVGPPGCGKSTVVALAARTIGVNLHVLNVSRLSPLEVEGVQMPVMTEEQMKLKLLTATFWTQLREGDIVLLEEFLRGFPEVYNALLDILTSREVAGFKLPKVFIIATSNSTVSYDKALEDRLLHLPVPDPRNRKGAKQDLAGHIVSALGLMPEMKDSYEMTELLDSEVLPMFDILDSFKGAGTKTSAGNSLKGQSIRKLIGMAQLREVQSPALAALISSNNQTAMRKTKAQFVLLLDGKKGSVPAGYEQAAAKLEPVKHKLTEIQRTNLELNLQLIQMESIRTEKGTTTDDDDTFIDDLLS